MNEATAVWALFLHDGAAMGAILMFIGLPMATFAAHVAGETAYNKEAYHSQEIAHKAEYEPKDAAHFCTTSALIKPRRYQAPVAYKNQKGKKKGHQYRH